MSADDTFEAAVRAIAEAARDGAPVPPDAFARARAILLGFVWTRLASRPDDPEDAVAEALARLVHAARDGSLDFDRPLGPYLLVVARRVAIDQWRRHGRREELVEAVPDKATDDEIARLLDAEATTVRVRQALRQVIPEDLTTSLVIRTWLDLAAQHGSAPSSREVADRAGVSHTTVLRALDRFREYL